MPEFSLFSWKVGVARDAFGRGLVADPVGDEIWIPGVKWRGRLVEILCEPEQIGSLGGVPLEPLPLLLRLVDGEHAGLDFLRLRIRPLERPQVHFPAVKGGGLGRLAPGMAPGHLLEP